MSGCPNEILFNGKVWFNGNSQLWPETYQDALQNPVPDLNLLPSTVIERSDPVYFSPTPNAQDRNNILPRKEFHLISGDAGGMSLTKELPSTVTETSDPVHFPATPNSQDKSNTLPRMELHPISRDSGGMSLPRELPSTVTETSDPVYFPATPNTQDKSNILPGKELDPTSKDAGGMPLTKEIDVIDLTKTPDEKTRRKKHVPKVVREGKSARKYATPKPVTPKPANKETSTGKRKYVRKKKPVDQTDSPSCPVRGDFSQENAGEGAPVRQQDAGQEDVGQSASVRRRLNFDSGEHEASNGQEVPPAQGQKVMMKNRTSDFVFDLNSSPGQFPRIPQRPNMSYRPSRRDTVRPYHVQNGYAGVVNGSTLPVQQSRREIMQVILENISRKSSYMTNGVSDMSPQSAMPHLTNTTTLRGTKRDQSGIARDLFPTRRNFVSAYNNGHISEIPDAGRYSSYHMDSQKKMRSEKARNEHTSNVSFSVRPTLTSSSRTNLMLPNSCQVYSLMDAERPTPTKCNMGLNVQNNCQIMPTADQQILMFLDRMGASEHMLSFDQVDVRTGKPPESPVQTNFLTPQSTISDCSHLPTPAKSSEFRSTNFRQLPTTTGKGYGCSNNEEGETGRPQACTVSPNTNDHGLKKIRRRSRKTGTPLTSDFSFPPGCRNTSGDPIDDIVSKLSLLNINGGREISPVKSTKKIGGREIVKATNQNALVPYSYRGGGAMVPYVNTLGIIKKRRLIIRVLLDSETNRVWNVLMGKESPNEKLDRENEKYWEEERRIFGGRVDSFIARMNHIQGDRRFSRWKGSVVDSVVGVFLTQNVADHLSSSAFMTLAARFPLRSNTDNNEHDAEKVSSSSEERQSCIIDPDDSVKGPELLGPELYSQGSSLNPELEHSIEKEIANSNVVSSQNSEYLVPTADQNGVRLLPDMYGGNNNEYDGLKGPEVLGPELCSQGSSLNVGHEPSTDREMANRTAVSSQNSGYLGHLADQDSVSLLPDMYGVNAYDSSTSFLELLQMAETTGFQGLSTHASRRDITTESCGEVEPLVSLDVDAYHHHLTTAPAPSPFDDFWSSFTAGNINAEREEDRSHLFSNASGMTSTNQNEIMSRSCGALPNSSQLTDRSCCTSGENSTKTTSGTEAAFDFYNPVCESSVPLTFSESVHVDKRSFHPTDLASENDVGSSWINTPSNFWRPQDEQIYKPQEKESEIVSQAKFTQHAVRTITSSESEVPVSDSSVCPIDLTRKNAVDSSGISTPGNFCHLQDIPISKLPQKESEIASQAKTTEHPAGSQVHMQSGRTVDVMEAVKSKIKTEPVELPSMGKKASPRTQKVETRDWDVLRKAACQNGVRKERSKESMDSVDWEAVRAADLKDIVKAIEKRGMSTMLGKRIKLFLDRVVADHGSIDLEWVRDIPPGEAKEYLLSMKGLGLKSVECVRLLTLHQLAFPVDINVSRIIVRLGWVPVEPLPEALQFHGLEVYPTLDSVQKYIWPRLCKLDQRTLYELHYHLITFGKVFCAKRKPNCSACPMKAECKHFASACASQRFALPAPEEKRIVESTVPIAFETNNTYACNPMPLPQLKGPASSEENNTVNHGEPIIEEPRTPEPEPEPALEEILQQDIEDAFNGDDPDDIPYINLIPPVMQKYLQEHNMELQDGDLSQALVTIAPGAGSKPMPKLKNASRLRTAHHVYQLPDSHPLLKDLDLREPDDPCPYFLAIWSAGETAKSTEQPKYCCNSQDTGKLCNTKTCFGCNSSREAQSQTVRGTLLIPCRTAMRGSFPLNGTYFQVNEVFADHESSCKPIVVPRALLGHLPRRSIYFGTSVPTIFRGLNMEEIQHCFREGYVCVRGFDRKTRAPRPLQVRFHLPASRNGKVIEDEE